MTDLQRQIELAQEAAATVAALETVKAQAEQLPALKRQLATEHWVAQAGPAATLAERQAQRILQDVAPRMAAWRERLQTLYSEIHDHCAALPALQNEIADAGRYAKQAAAYRQGIAERTAPAASTGMGNEVPVGMVADGFDEVWRQCGGYDADLQIMPHFEATVRLRLQRLVEWALQRPYVFYNPKNAGR